jgi:hypothetical protein
MNEQGKSASVAFPLDLSDALFRLHIIQALAAGCFEPVLLSQGAVPGNRVQ